MAPPRETSSLGTALGDDAWWSTVEEDVEKKRHVKDPFRAAYVALVAAPFDAFLAKSRAPTRGKRAADADGDGDADDDVDMEGEGGHGDGEPEDPVALQQEISARSQQVHLRLEILRRQMQCLVKESSAILGSEGAASKKESHKKKKAVSATDVASNQDGEAAIIDLEELLERVALYESGELAETDLQKAWARDDQSPLVMRHAVDINQTLDKMNAALEEDFQAICEQNMLYFGPNPPISSVDASTSTPEGAAACEFLEACKRSIKPFFLEDFVQLSIEDSQTRDDEAVMDAFDSSTEATAIASPAPPPLQSSVEDAVMDECQTASQSSLARQTPTLVELAVVGAGDPSDQEEQDATRSTFCVTKVKEKRLALRAKARNLNAEHHKQPRLPVRASRQISEASNSAKKPAAKVKFAPLLCDTKLWRNFPMSIIDPAVNLVELRQALSVDLDEPTDDESLELHERVDESTGLIDSMFSLSAATAHDEESGPPVEARSDSDQGQTGQPLQTKRPLDVVEDLNPKKQRVKDARAPPGSLSLRMVMQTIHESLRRVAQTSCVSYLSTLVRSHLPPCNPQRVFVALVFSASLSNASRRSHVEEPLQVTLQSANAGRDVKIICRQE